MTTYFLDTGAMQRMAQGGSLDLLLSAGNRVYVTSTVLGELQRAAGLGYTSAQNALNWFDQNKSGPSVSEIPTPEAAGTDHAGELSIRNYLYLVGGSNYKNSDFNNYGDSALN